MICPSSIIHRRILQLQKSMEGLCTRSSCPFRPDGTHLEILGGRHRAALHLWQQMNLARRCRWESRWVVEHVLKTLCELAQLSDELMKPALVLFLGEHGIEATASTPRAASEAQLQLMARARCDHFDEFISFAPGAFFGVADQVEVLVPSIEWFIDQALGGMNLHDSGMS
jgi:hypothetical protein